MLTARQLANQVGRDEIVDGLGRWTRRERSATAMVVALLASAEREKVYIEHGFETLRSFCIDGLGYTESEANARIRAALAALLYEEILDDLESKALTLTAVRHLSRYLTGGSVGAELLAAARHKSGREIQALIARRFPESRKPRDALRTTPTTDGRVKLEALVPVEVTDKLQRAREGERRRKSPDDVGQILSRALDLFIASAKPFGVPAEPEIGTVRQKAATTGQGAARTTIELTTHRHENERAKLFIKTKATLAELDARELTHLRRDALFGAMIRLGFSPQEAETRAMLALVPALTLD
jgi:hypothetical protein